MPTTMTSRTFCQRERSSPFESRRVTSQEPTVSTPISAQVKTIVAFNSTKPLLQ